jgi:hypothetical protein
MKSGEAQEMNAPSLNRERGSSDCGHCVLFQKFVSYALYCCRGAHFAAKHCQAPAGGFHCLAVISV